MKHKAPSGRELSSKCETEGARVYVSVALVLRRAICPNAAGSFRHFLAKMPPPSRRKAFMFCPNTDLKRFQLHLSVSSLSNICVISLVYSQTL